MGPLSGIKVVEIGGIGPGPICGMILADLGAEVIVIERGGEKPASSGVDAALSSKTSFHRRGKKSIVLDLKNPDSVEVALKIAQRSDVLIEGFRPGVMERLGLGPDICLARNKKLIFGRQTGWGQTGPLAQAAGHDINYVALSGALYYTGHDGEAPFTPPTVVGDVAGGAMVHVIGILAALQHARRTGEGQVIDAAITDGATYMMTLLASMRETGLFTEPRDTGLFSGGAPWYQAFECADGEFVTIGSLEPQFYQLLLEKCGLQEDPDFDEQFSLDDWPRAFNTLKTLFKNRSRAEWCELLEGTDVCFAPVLNYVEAQRHPHNVARQNFVAVDGHIQPAPAPKFGKTPMKAGRVAEIGEHTEEIMQECDALVDVASSRTSGGTDNEKH